VSGDCYQAENQKAVTLSRHEA